MGESKYNMVAQGCNCDRMAAGWSLGQSLGGILLALESSNGVGRSVIVQHMLLAVLSYLCMHSCLSLMVAVQTATTGCF